MTTETKKHWHAGLSTKQGRNFRTLYCYNCVCCKYSTPWFSAATHALGAFERHAACQEKV